MLQEDVTVVSLCGYICQCDQALARLEMTRRERGGVPKLSSAKQKFSNKISFSTISFHMHL